MPPKKPRRALLKQELVELCASDHVKALVLERLLYKTRMAEEYAAMQEEAGKGNDDTEEAGRGWITISAAALVRELMLGTSQKTVRRRLAELVQEGYLLENAAYNGWRGASSYKVNIELVQLNLFALGYVLDGYGLPIPETTRTTTMDDKQEKPTYDPDKEWDKIPSASHAHVAQGRLPGMESMGAWAAGHKLLAGAPQHILITSWLLWKHGGFTPYGTKRSWFSACSGLWEAAGGNEHTLNAAIENGQSVRLSRGLTMSGPRSFVTFALDARARHELQGRAAAQPPEARREAALGRLHGQTVSTTDTGKQVIEIGRKHGK